MAMKIPAGYWPQINSIIATAKGFLEKGEPLTPMAFVASFTTDTVTPIMLDSRDNETKERSAAMIAAAAADIDADYVFTVMEAWALPKKYLNRVEEIYDKYGSLANFPHRLDVVNFMLETRHGLWSSQCTIKPMPPSKKRRTIMPPEFMFVDGAEGRFANLLPVKDGTPPGSTLQ